MTNRTATLLSVALTALCLAACAPGIDVGQATGTGNATGTSTGTVTTTGTGGAIDAFLTVSPNPLGFGTIIANTTATQSVTLTNPTSVEVDGITADVSGPESGWFQVLNAPSTLAPGSSTTVSIEFDPLGQAAAAAAVATFSANGINPVALILTGGSVGVALQVANNRLDFGYVPLLSTAIACTTVSNVLSDIAVTIESVTSFATEGNAYALATTDDATPPNPFTLPLTISPGGSAKVCFAFTPPITQQYDGQATLVTNDPSGTNLVVQLTGWGGGPQINCTPLSLSLDASDGGLATKSVLCTNTGTAIPAVDLVFGTLSTSSNAFTAQFDTDPGAAGLVPGQTATIYVTYDPFVDGGSAGTLQIPSNGGQGQPVSVLLSGTNN